MADELDVTTEGEEEAPNGLQNQCRFEEADDAPDWVSLCYRARLRRRASWLDLGKQFKRDWRTVRSNVQKYSRAVAEAYLKGDVGFLAEYIDGVQDDRTRADDVFTAAEEPLQKMTALRHITECRKLIASALGVVTERKGVAVSGESGRPPVRVAFDPMVFDDDEEAQDAAFVLVKRVLAGGTGKSSGSSDAAELGSGDGAGDRAPAAPGED